MEDPGEDPDDDFELVPEPEPGLELRGCVQTRDLPLSKFFKEHVSEEKPCSKDLCWFVGSLVIWKTGCFRRRTVRLY